MKVLFISSWYPNSTNPLKGIFIKKHAEAIKKAGVEIEVLALTVSYSKKLFEKKFSRTVDEAGITTHLIELNSRFYKFIHVDLILQFAYMKKYFYRKIKPNFSPDIIHSNVLFPAAILGYWLAKKENCNHVITEHWSKVDSFLGKSLYSKSGKKAYNSAKFVTVVSEFLRKSLSKHFQSPENIKVVPNVVDTSIFSYKPKASAEKFTFCCVAHWNGVKRPDLIFNALEKFSKQNQKPIVLNVIGEGPLLEELKNKKWNFEINYLGNLVRQQLAEKLQASDYFLHASDMETFSIVIAEALATGTPVLASNAGAIPELINNDNGLICNNDVESWTKGISDLINTKFDNQKISENAQGYNLNKVGDKFLELYKQINP
jgi:glycosyltransferase involved in cell wall biosynthesis